MHVSQNLLQPNDRIVFFGDSITDAQRTHHADPETALGNGYVALCTALLGARFPEWNLQIWNRGIGGNRLIDLHERLERDVLSLQPTVVSVLIGINDTWRRFDQNLVSEIPPWEQSYTELLSTLQSQCSARLVVLEPFLLHTQDDLPSWREDLNPRIDASRRVAQRFGARYLPLDGIFAAAACRAPEKHWLHDGVHPTPAGHGLIAQHWLREVTGFSF